VSDAIERVGVIGAGQMGAGIAEVSARAGVDVLVFETTEALITAGRARIVKSLERGVSAGKITERERDAAVGRLKFTTNVADLADRQLVIEAIIEDETVKSQIFAELDKVITDTDAVLASNTSSIPIMKLAAATQNPSRVLGLHFFNPVPVLPLVELVGTLVTSDAALQRTEEFASVVLGKQASCLRIVGSRNPDPKIAALEEEFKELGNSIGMGAMGFVGSSMVIDCHVEVGYCHTGGMPMSVHMFCLSSRRACARISADGKAAFRTDPMWFTDYMRRETVEWERQAAEAAE